MPIVVITSTTTTTITLYWSAPSGSVVSSYEIRWQRLTPNECSSKVVGSTHVPTGYNSYTIMKLGEGSRYDITVVAKNANGSAVSGSVTGSTRETGETSMEFV